MFSNREYTEKLAAQQRKHLLAHGKEVRALVRNHEKAAGLGEPGRGTGRRRFE